ncbi:hypothetical protein D9611_009160 [Ephemerocybe angulata]|uniref:Uncharacterized protein n=1 Tax=Ephemerocybe angulata TaxID=980116 RepID=A0A8H5CFZ7_9AGAR|nr:hypothetical protein D9611_009160 [Tulosesus angulatus]
MDNLLISTSDALKFLSTNVVHPTYFPYLWAPTLHAARISLVYQTLARKAGLGTYSKFPWGPYIAGYLVSCWAGGIITNFLLGMPPPMAYSFQPYINYLAVHLGLTAFFSVFPFLLIPKIFDTLLFPMDALLRSLSVTGTLGLLDNPNVPPAFKAMNNPFGHILLGALASASGGISMSTFSLTLPSWQFSTPPILTAGLWSSADVWGGALAAVIFGAATQSPAFTIPSTNPAVLGPAYFPLNLVPQTILELLFRPSAVAAKGASQAHILALSPQVAPHVGKAMAAVALAVVFGSRALYTHWLSSPVAQKAPVTQGKKAGSKTIRSQ